MKKPKKTSLSSARKKAKSTQKKQDRGVKRLDEKNVRKPAHEPGTHQIELEMQNEGLRRAQEELEESRSRYVDLYDFAPVGYFTFDKTGRILEVNLTGAGMLGVNRRFLVKRTFTSFLAGRADQDIFRVHREEVLRTQARQTCEIMLRRKGASSFAAQLISMPLEAKPGLFRASVIDISERKAGEKSLRENELRLSLFIDHVPAALAMFDRDMRYVSASRRWMSDFDLGDRDLRGLSLYEVFPDIPERWKAVHRRALAGEVVRDDNDHFDRADGSVQWLRWEVRPWRDAAGKVAGIVVFSEDITERKQTEQERERVLLDLKRRTTELDAVFRALPYLVSVHGPDGRYVRVNPALVSLFGFDPARASREEVARRVQARFPDGRRLTPENMPSTRALRGETINEVEYLITDGQGRERVLLVNAIPLSVEGHVYGVVLAQMDITERKLAMESLGKAKDLSEALNRINKAVHSTFDTEEIMRRVIKEAAEAVGCDSAAISLRDKDGWVVRYVHGIPQETVGNRMTDAEEPHAMLALTTGKPVAINDALRDERVNAGHMKKFGVKSVMVVPLIAGEQHVGAIFFNHHAAAVAFSDAQIDFADKLASTITLAIDNARLLEAWKRAEEKVRNLNEELKRSFFELEAVNVELETFSYSVSHDLRAPLRSIEGFTTAIIEDCGAQLDETGRDYFNRVVAASRRMSQLIDAMLHMARLTRGEMREKAVNLSALAEGIVSELRRGKPDRQVEFLIAPEIKVHGDTDMLRIVLENLLDNAFKFTSRHGTANIQFGRTEMKGKAVYFVRDDGAGFDMRYAENLFKPFKRLHAESEFPGIGIGLATAHRIINRHNGRIWAESEVEKGATFYFTV